MPISEDHAPAPTLRVVLVDTRDERRGLMRNLVDGSESGASVVAEAGDRDAALLMVDEQRADVVLLDVQMPIADGLGANVHLPLWLLGGTIGLMMVVALGSGLMALRTVWRVEVGILLH